MKTKTLLLASLLVAALTAQAQTVEYTDANGKSSKSINEFQDHDLQNATNITLSGAWDDEDLSKLRLVLIQEDYKNKQLKTADLSAMTFSGIISNGMTELFNHCEVLSTLKMPTDASAANVHSFSETFWYCSELTEVDLSAFTGISYFGGAFGSCEKLKTVKMPAKNDCEDIYGIDFSNAFEFCSELTEIDLSAFTNIHDLTGIFDQCRKLTTVKMPAKNTTYMYFNYAFRGCSELRTIDISGFTNVGSFSATFSGCKNLTEVKMPASSESEDAYFRSTFSGCSKLTSVDLRAFTRVTDYKETFHGCTSMEEIYLGTAVIFEPENYGGSYTDTFTDCPSTCKVYLPKGVMEAPEAWRDAPVTFIPDGGGAGIEANGVTEAIPAISHVYSIDGRLIKTVPAAEYSTLKNGLDRGIYIVNGEKMMVE